MAPIVCILERRDFFNMKTLLQLLMVQKLIFSNCVLFQNNLLPSDTVPLNRIQDAILRQQLQLIVNVLQCVYI